MTDTEPATDATSTVALTGVDPTNWRAVADLQVGADQEQFVAPVTRYLALCAYDSGPWQPLAVTAGDSVVGFVMHAVDTTDDSLWIGGLVIDRSQQQRGYGRATVRALGDRAVAAGRTSVALSYHPDNHAARNLYASLGFVETGETEDDEVVARLILR